MEMKTPPDAVAALIETREVFRGRQFVIAADKVVLPNGNQAEYGVIRHPGSTAIVPIMDDGSILMTLQYRYPVGEYLLEIPAGTMEAGESALECAKRELEEETGFAAKEFTELASVYICPAYSDEKAHIFLARDLRPSTARPDEDEIIQVVRYTLGALMSMVEEGKITDALTLVSLCQARMYLR